MCLKVFQDLLGQVQVLLNVVSVDINVIDKVELLVNEVKQFLLILLVIGELEVKISMLCIVLIDEVKEKYFEVLVLIDWQDWVCVNLIL